MGRKNRDFLIFASYLYSEERPTQLSKPLNFQMILAPASLLIMQVITIWQEQHEITTSNHGITPWRHTFLFLTSAILFHLLSVLFNIFQYIYLSLLIPIKWRNCGQTYLWNLLFLPNVSGSQWTPEEWGDVKEELKTKDWPLNLKKLVLQF